MSWFRYWEPSVSCGITVIFSDIDECALGSSGCSDVCENTPGSFLCHCGDSAILSPDGLTCYSEVSV